MHLTQLRPVSGSGRIAGPNRRFLTAETVQEVFRGLPPEASKAAEGWLRLLLKGWASRWADFELYGKIYEIVGGLILAARASACRRPKGFELKQIVAAAVSREAYRRTEAILDEIREVVDFEADRACVQEAFGLA